MPFELEAQQAKLTSVNPRAELHGEDKKPAAHSAGQEPAAYVRHLPNSVYLDSTGCKTRWEDLPDGTPVYANAAPVNASEPVGTAGTMPGTEGFTMACFEAAKVPVGTDLYTSNVNGGGRDTVEVAVALEQQRTLAIVKAVRDINFGESPTGMPTPASAAYDLACEEIERRVRTEQWELDGAAAPLPSAERAADTQQVGGDEREAFEAWWKTITPQMYAKLTPSQFAEVGWRAGRAALSADGGEDKRDRAWSKWILDQKFYDWNTAEQCAALHFNAGFDAAIAANQSGKGGEQ